eukprot:jgi/Botrbrau1/22162/Bobra.0417s0001.1
MLCVHWYYGVIKPSEIVLKRQKHCRRILLSQGKSLHQRVWSSTERSTSSPDRSFLEIFTFLTTKRFLLISER